MGLSHELGLVTEGYLADLLLVAGDPLKDVTILQHEANLAVMMQDGRPYKETPAALRRNTVAAE
jgi:imidazolonepropionase-like amidohydrolase